MSVRGQNSKGETQSLIARTGCRARRIGTGMQPEDGSRWFPLTFSLTFPPTLRRRKRFGPWISGPAADFLKTTLQTERRAASQEERRHFAQVCRDYLEKSFNARIRAAQDRVIALRAREAGSPEVALARQRSEQDLADLQRTRQERLAGLERLTIARHGPVRHIATALVLPSTASAAAQINALLEDLDPVIRRRIELAAEDVVLAYESAVDGNASESAISRSASTFAALAQRIPRPATAIPFMASAASKSKGVRRAAHPPDYQRMVQGPATRRFLLALRRLGSRCTIQTRYR